MTAPDLNFRVERVEPEPYSAAPLLVFRLRIEQAAAAEAPAPVHAVALRCQIRIDPALRRYTPAEQDRLLELFGRTSQWGQTLRSMLWTHAGTVVPAFRGGTTADLPVPCTYDFNVAATKYFDALEDGEVPLSLLFSGTVFYQAESGALQAGPISWEKEATFRLPARVWRQMMEQLYPNVAWLGLNKDLFDRLRRFKARAGHVTFDQAIDELLQGAAERQGAR
jgi:hypothetical protein